ncbi:MAG: deoxyribodipyrimidine photo-lyase [Pseudomonadota bacterium]
MAIAWFKRDLRVEDNEALSAALIAVNDTESTDKPQLVLPLYIIEPELWQQPDMSERHYVFLTESLRELDESLKNLGQGLIIKIGNVVDILNDISGRYKISALYSHQETWNGWTYQRDKNVNKWCQDNDITWHQPAQNGVIRCLDDRDGWAARWYNKMKKPVLKAPEFLTNITEESELLPKYQQLIGDSENQENLYQFTDLQPGGRQQALLMLDSFLQQRGEGYSKEMSSPVTAFDSCSRLSTHLAFGTISIREVFQACERRNKQVKAMPPAMKGKWPGALRSFSGRLRWHCHFIQKLEDEPRIEFENMHYSYDDLREKDFNDEYFLAWKNGMTGYPMVDACMRALAATGWLNFRMRAMVMSFASYHLWLHWRQPALHLAKMFTDYEPGIHYSQVQMQSGTTGINAIRIYNPIKQAVDQDPDGIFIRHWIPELRDMPQEFIHTPWQSESQMNGYPRPIIDEKTARQAAASKIYGLRKNNSQHKEMSKQIVKKHGSRKSGLPRSTDKARKQIKDKINNSSDIDDIKRLNDQGELPL